MERKVYSIYVNGVLACNISASSAYKARESAEKVSRRYSAMVKNALRNLQPVNIDIRELQPSNK